MTSRNTDLTTLDTKALRRSLDNLTRGIRIKESKGENAEPLRRKRNAVLNELNERTFAAAHLQLTQKWSNR